MCIIFTVFLLVWWTRLYTSHLKITYIPLFFIFKDGSFRITGNQHLPYFWRDIPSFSKSGSVSDSRFSSLNSRVCIITSQCFRFGYYTSLYCFYFFLPLWNPTFIYVYYALFVPQARIKLNLIWKKLKVIFSYYSLSFSAHRFLLRYVFVCLYVLLLLIPVPKYIIYHHSFSDVSFDFLFTFIWIFTNVMHLELFCDQLNWFLISTCEL